MIQSRLTMSILNSTVVVLCEEEYFYLALVFGLNIRIIWVQAISSHRLPQTVRANEILRTMYIIIIITINRILAIYLNYNGDLH